MTRKQNPEGKRHTKTTLIIRQVEDHVCPDLVSRVPTICVLLDTLFQECVINFEIHILFLQNTTITEQNVRVSIF
jgi:hypothetical protein